MSDYIPIYSSLTDRERAYLALFAGSEVQRAAYVEGSRLPYARVMDRLADCGLIKRTWSDTCYAQYRLTVLGADVLTAAIERS